MVSKPVVWSLVLGILAPIVCLALQPVLLPGEPFLPGLRFINIFRVFGYGVMGLAMLSLATWLAAGSRLGALTGAMAGVLLAGAMFAGGLGLILLPFSLIGILAAGIGLLGLVPLGTSFVYFRNGARALRLARDRSGAARAWAGAILGAGTVIGVPTLGQAGIERAIGRTIGRVADGEAAALSGPSALTLHLHPDRLVWAYDDERDPARRERLARFYEQLTGLPIESRLAILLD